MSLLLLFSGGATQLPDIGWLPPLSEPRRYKQAVRAAAVPYQFLVQAAPFPEIVFYDRFAFPWSQPYPAKRWLRPGAHPYQAFQPTPIIDVSWFNPLSEPRRFKPALRTAAQLAFTFHPNPVIQISWWRPLDEPRRYRPALRTGQHPFHNFQPNPIIDISWWRPLDEPRRYKPKLLEGRQLFFAMPSEPVVSFSWIYGLSEPVRKKPTLIEAAKEKASHLIFVNVPGSTGPLFIRAKLGRRATFWKGRSDGR